MVWPHDLEPSVALSKLGTFPSPVLFWLVRTGTEKAPGGAIALPGALFRAIVRACRDAQTRVARLLRKGERWPVMVFRLAV